MPAARSSTARPRRCWRARPTPTRGACSSRSRRSRPSTRCCARSGATRRAWSTCPPAAPSTLAARTSTGCPATCAAPSCPSWSAATSWAPTHPAATLPTPAPSSRPRSSRAWPEKEYPVSSTPASGAPLLSVRDLKMHFPIKNTDGLFAERQIVQAVDGVSFDLGKGQTLGLAITRLYKPTSGQIVFEGTDLAGLPESKMRPFRRELQMVFQDPYSSLNPRQTVGSIISTPLQVHGLAKGKEIQRVQELLERVGLNPEHHNRYPNEFSGGQRQRIGIARALAVEPQVIVADEPVSALDV